MADPVILIITDATVSLGDLPVLPATEIDPALLTDFKCQVTRAEITATSTSTTTDRAATFCSPASQQQQVPQASTFGLALEGFQDWTATAGISAWLFKNDATEKAFALFLEGETDPSAVGKVVVVAGAFAGVAQTPLTFAVELPIQGYPDIKDSAGASIRAA